MWDLRGAPWLVEGVSALHGDAKASEVLVTPTPPVPRLIVNRPPALVTATDVEKAIKRAIGLLAA
jgi:hypothetical protein